MIERAHQIAQSMADRPGALLPILHAVQDEFGYIPTETVAAIAQAVNRSRAEVHGVISFYHLLRTTPPGEKTVYICRAESCQAMGSAALEDQAKKQLGIGFHETTADGKVSLEPVYCLGNCACSPSIRIGDDIHARVTPERFNKLVGG